MSKTDVAFFFRVHFFKEDYGNLEHGSDLIITMSGTGPIWVGKNYPP